MIELLNNYHEMKGNNRAASGYLQVHLGRILLTLSYLSVDSCKAKTVGTGYSCTVSVCPHLSDKRKGQTSGTGGVAGRSLASAMMCSKVMSVCVQTSATHTS